MEHNIDIIATGEAQYQKHSTIVVPFENLEIIIQLDEFNQFVGIKEVRINKNFCQSSDMMKLKGFHDVEKYYED